MRFRTILYYGIEGYEEDGTPLYKVQAWNCENEGEYEYALNILNEDDIVDIY